MTRRLILGIALLAGSALGYAQEAGLWVQAWSYDMPGEQAYLEQLAQVAAAETGEPCGLVNGRGARDLGANRGGDRDVRHGLLLGFLADKG